MEARGGQKVRVRENAVHKGFLHNDAAVRQAFDVQEGRMGQLFQPPQAGQFHNAQIFAALEDVHCAFLKGRGGHHFKVVGGHHFCSLTGKGAVDHHSPAKGGDAVAPESLVQGRTQALAAPGRAAGIVVLEDERGRAVRKVLQNVGPVVHVREVVLPGCLPAAASPFSQGLKQCRCPVPAS